MRDDGKTLGSSDFKAQFGMSRTDFERLAVLEAMVTADKPAQVRRLSFSDAGSPNAAPLSKLISSPVTSILKESGPTIEEMSDSDEDDEAFEKSQSLRSKFYERDVKFRDADADISFGGSHGEDIETILDRFERVVAGSAPQKFYEVLLTRITNSTVKDTLRSHVELDHCSELRPFHATHGSESEGGLLYPWLDSRIITSVTSLRRSTR
jgi:hypothetical protein